MSLAQQHRPDLAVLDLDLGEGPTGIHLAHGLRKLNANIAIVMLSTYGDPSWLGQRRRPPVGARYLVKGEMSNTEVLAAAMNDKDDVNHAFTMAASLCKARDWTYEQEWRIVYPDDRTRRCMALPAPLKAVHLGARISADNASRIRDICAASGIPVHTMALSRQEYRMESHLPAG